MKGMRFAGFLSAVLAVLLCAPGIGQAASINGKVVFAGPVPAQKKVSVTISDPIWKEASQCPISPNADRISCMAINSRNVGRTPGSSAPSCFISSS